MSSVGSITQYVSALEHGDHAAAQRLWERYFESLVKLARQQLRARSTGLGDEEDVALSAFNSFCQGLEQRQFHLESRGDLWALLSRIAQTKALELARRESACKRQPGTVRSSSLSLLHPGENALDVPSPEPTPEAALQFAEEMQRLLDQLGSDRQRHIAMERLAGYTNEEISRRLDISRRTVERKLASIRKQWSRSCEPPMLALPTSVPMPPGSICQQFEDAWRMGRRPRIEDFIIQVGDEARCACLRELILVEVESRRGAGESPTPDEYLGRFPLYPQVVREAFRLFNSSDDSEGSLSSLPSTSLLMPSHPASVHDLPDRLGRYSIKGCLGRGAFGTVYLAHDPNLGREVAIKVLCQACSSSANDVRRLIEEAQMAAKLEHPGIVPIYDVGSHAGQLFIVQRYVGGRTLAEYLRSSVVTFEQAANLTATVAEALAFAHQFGIYHRDLKPNNILLDERMEPRIADFGLAIHESIQRDRRGELAGTPPYMSPEQTRGDVHMLDGESAQRNRGTNRDF